MGATSEFYGELSRLKKEVLIDIVLKKCVPDGISLSKELRRFISKSDDDAFSESVCGVRTNLEQDLKVVKLEGEIVALQTEVRCSRVLISTLQKTITDKEEIILMLKSKNNREDSFTQSSVAGSSRLSPGKKSGDKVSFGEKSSPRVPRQRGMGFKQPVVVGERETCDSSEPLSFAGAARKAWLYVGRAGVDTTTDQIARHLKKNFPSQEFVIDSLPTRENANSIAFRVGADMSLIDDLNKPNLWPKGIVVKRYRFFRHKSGAS